MSRHRLVALILLSAVSLLSLLPSLGSAQTSADEFLQIVAGDANHLPLAGPTGLTLEQAPGVLTVARAQLDVADFVAHAVFANPDDDEGPWDYGFQFRTAGNNDDPRLFVLSDGTWNFTIGVAPPIQAAVTPSLDMAPGATNTLDLVVDGSRALFGVNGVYAGSVVLPEAPASGDVYASTGFLSNLVVPGRLIGLSDFTVYDLPGAEGRDGAAPLALSSVARPVTLYEGSCDALGDAIDDLREAVIPAGEWRGQASAVVAEASYSTVPFAPRTLLDEPHALAVGASADTPDTIIACGDLGGVPDDAGGFAVGLGAWGESGYSGIAYLTSGDDPETAGISVLVAPAMAPGRAAEIATPLTGATPAAAGASGNAREFATPAP